MRQAQREFAIETHGPGLYEFTAEVERWLREVGLQQGLLTLFCRHTSASLLIQENADPDVVHDLAAFFSRLVPPDGRLYRHTIEGPDDMPAHIRAALTPASLAIPVVDGRAALGAWQGIYLFEHRQRPHRRHVLGHVVGE
ncbi:MAG: secondary thiamine-phosphate synthase enzyme YjbQ [Bryobacteraceae bacterium]